MRALAGLFRIAFSPVDDAVAMAFADDGESVVPLGAAPDLHCIGEIKRQKGGVELKLADRMKALELLLRWSRERDRGKDSGKSLLTVLERSVNALGETRD